MHSRSSGVPLADKRSDPLAAIIQLLHPQTVLSKIISGAGPWSVHYAAHKDPGFCLMLHGACFLKVEGRWQVVQKVFARERRPGNASPAR